MTQLTVQDLKHRRSAAIAQRLRYSERAAKARYFRNSNGRDAAQAANWSRQIEQLEAQLSALDPSWNRAEQGAKAAATGFGAVLAGLMALAALTVLVQHPKALVAFAVIGVPAAVFVLGTSEKR